jgi:hypothetical protein
MLVAAVMILIERGKGEKRWCIIRVGIWVFSLKKFESPSFLKKSVGWFFPKYFRIG